MNKDIFNALTVLQHAAHVRAVDGMGTLDGSQTDTLIDFIRDAEVKVGLLNMLLDGEVTPVIDGDRILWDRHEYVPEPSWWSNTRHKPWRDRA